MLFMLQTLMLFVYQLLLLVLLSTGKKELGFETPSGDVDVSETSTLGKIHRHFFLLIG